jgi:hypothetical protein
MQQRELWNITRRSSGRLGALLLALASLTACSTTAPPVYTAAGPKGSGPDVQQLTDAEPSGAGMPRRVLMPQPAPAAEPGPMPAPPPAPAPAPMPVMTTTSPVVATPAQCPAVAADALPALAWPPAQPSSTLVVPRVYLTGARPSVSLGEVASKLTSALRGADYDAERFSFLSVPNGFALVTSVERIRPDASYTEPRYTSELPRAGDLGFGSFIQSLFMAPRGLYRVITFVVTDVRRDKSTTPADEREFDKLLECGHDRLSEKLAARPFTEAMRVEALVYEFTKTSERQPATQVKDEKRKARQHLEQAGIWKQLEPRE